jgi:YhcH/YjgK/YiaL family protein
MVFDALYNADLYYNLGEKIKKAFYFLENTDLQNLQPGRIEIDGDEVFAMVQKYNTKDYSEGKWEAHRKYLDIQYMVHGSESFGFVNIDYLEPLVEYNEENDIEFLIGEGDFLQLNDEEFVIVYPSDAHMPGIVVEQYEEVFKIVIKVKL